MRWGNRKSQSALMVLTLQSPLGPRRAHDNWLSTLFFAKQIRRESAPVIGLNLQFWFLTWFQSMMSPQQALGAQGKKDKSPRVRDISCIIRLTLGNRRAALPQNCPRCECMGFRPQWQAILGNPKSNHQRGITQFDTARFSAR